MAPMPTPRSLLTQQTPSKTPQSKQRLNFPNPKSGGSSGGGGGGHPSLINTLSVTPTEHPVEVVGRIRDYPNRKEKPSSSSSALEISGDGRSLRVRTDIGYRDFSLDGVSLSEIEDLEAFYKRFVESRVEGVRSGAKCTIMMYGPTGAGKSHTMFGCARQAGIVYRALRDILGEGEMNDPEIGLTLFVQVAVLEIYNEEIYDLLSGGNAGGAATGIALPKGSTPKAKLEVMGRKAKNATYICGNEAVKISREVAKVEKRRIVKNTLLNERSSRSHCVIIMDVPAVGGRLMLVDMAGSENIEQAGQAGFEAKMQTAKINQGNIALKRVVESIANGDSHVPFRDSKLTMLLQDSFEDDKSKFLMILCASPDPKEMHKTIATLEYGAKAKCIVRVAHMPTPRDKLGIEDSSSLLRSRIVVMNQFIYKLQMENKFKDKELDKARSELLCKEEEILQLSSKLELMEGRGAAAKEEEFKLRTKLIKMEEKVQQQQEELDFLRKQLEGAESAKKESPLHFENRDGGKFMKRLAEMCAGDQGMVKSMELDMGDQQYIHDVKEIEEDKNHAEIQFNGSQPDSYHPNIVEDDDFDVPKFPEKVYLSTVFERDDEGEEDRESLEEEIDKEVVDEAVGYNFSLSNYQPENLCNGKESESTRRTRIQNIFRLCGNHRELAQQVKISTPSKSKPEDANILHSSPSTLGLLTSVYGLDQESKENKEPKGVESADMMDVYVKWEASKELSGNTIRKLKVLKNSTLCDLRKLIETHLEETNNNQPFTFLLLTEPLGAPVAREKEATVLVGKLPICKNELNGYIACLRPTKSTVQRQNHVLPFSSLENTLPLHEMKA